MSLKAKIFDGIARFQREAVQIRRKIRPFDEMPMLSLPEPFGAEIQTFRDPQTALRTWPDKASQTWCLTGTLKETGGRVWFVDFFFSELRWFEGLRAFVPPIAKKTEPPILRFVSARIFDPRETASKNSHQSKLHFTEFRPPPKKNQDLTKLYWELPGFCFREEETPGSFRLDCSLKGIGAHLELKTNQPVLLGQGGFVENGFEMLSPAIQVQGSFSVDDTLLTGSGELFLHHTKTAKGIEQLGDLAAEDMLVVSIGDQKTLILRLFPHADGTLSSASHGKIGETHIVAEGFEFEVLEYWTSPQTAARYPVKIRLLLKESGTEYRLHALRADQEAFIPVLQKVWRGALVDAVTNKAAGFATFSPKPQNSQSTSQKPSGSQVLHALLEDPRA